MNNSTSELKIDKIIKEIEVNKLKAAIFQNDRINVKHNL